MEENANSRITAFIILLAVAAAAYLLYPREPAAGEYDSLAKCITAKGISMAGTETCPHCKEQKKTLGTSFEYIDYHNCDVEPNWCNSKKVMYYPSWILANGKVVSGTQSIEQLKELTGCE